MVSKEQLLTMLEPTKLPCIRITPEPDRTPGPTDSRFGGDYYLPAGAEASKLEFLAQVNFAQVPPLEGFPQSGLLQVFLCTGEKAFEDLTANRSAFLADSGLFQVRWYPEPPADGPSHPSAVPRARRAMEPVAGGMKFEPAEETATLSLGSEEDFASDLGFEAAAKLAEELFLEDYARQEAGEDEYDEDGYDLSDCSGVNDLFQDFGNWGIKLGGHPSLRYEDIRTEEEAYRDYTALLFQLDLTILSGEDADTFCFFLKPEDLRTCRFDNILLTWHSGY